MTEKLSTGAAELEVKWTGLRSSRYRLQLTHPGGADTTGRGKAIEAQLDGKLFVGNTEVPLAETVRLVQAAGK